MAIERHLLKSTVIQEIKNYIIDNGLSAEDKLPTEKVFTEMFDVSRSVVREALSYLENTGVIYVKQGRGAFINKSNISHLVNNFFFLWKVNGGDIRDIQSLRLLFETAAIDEIVLQQQHNNLSVLRQLISYAREAETKEAFREMDRKFHQKILEATDNHLFIQMTQVITTYFFEATTVEIDKCDIEQANREHERIVDALENGDVKQAKDLLRGHMIHTNFQGDVI